MGLFDSRIGRPIDRGKNGKIMDDKIIKAEGKMQELNRGGRGGAQEVGRDV